MDMNFMNLCFHDTSEANDNESTCKSEHDMSLIVAKSEEPSVQKSDIGTETDDWERIVQPSKENFDKLLMNLVLKTIKPNVQIRVGIVNFNCHMIVLQCYSEFFMEFDDEIRISLPQEKISSNAFLKIYRWMLSDKPVVQREGILELFTAAKYLRIKALVNQCWSCIDDAACFQEDNAFLLYIEARKFGLEIVKELMIKRIKKYFLTLVSSNEFLDLDEKEVCDLLSLNTIAVNSEIEVFMSAVLWLNADWSKRESSMVTVLQCVRFKLLPSWFLMSLMRNPDCAAINRIVYHPEVVQMIDDGMCFATILEFYGDNNEDCYNLVKCYDLGIPLQRQCVYDIACSYHCLQYAKVHSTTYRSFIEYMERIPKLGKDHWRSLKNLEDINKTFTASVGSENSEGEDFLQN